MKNLCFYLEFGEFKAQLFGRSLGNNAINVIKRQLRDKKTCIIFPMT